MHSGKSISLARGLSDVPRQGSAPSDARLPAPLRRCGAQECMRERRSLLSPNFTGSSCPGRNPHVVSAWTTTGFDGPEQSPLADSG